MRNAHLVSVVAWAGCLLCAGLQAAPADPFHVTASLTDAGTSWVAAVTFAVPPRHHVYADDLRVEDVGGIPLAPLDLPKPARIRDAYSGNDREIYTNDFALVYRVTRPLVTGLTLRVQYQGCNDTTCFFPQNRFFPLQPGPSSPPAGQVAGQPSTSSPQPPPPVTGPADWQMLDTVLTPAGQAAGYLNKAEFLAFLDVAQHGRAASASDRRSLGARFTGSLALFGANPVEFFHRFGTVWTLLLILAGGLLLNLTPCVLPMIPVNLAILGAGAQGSSRLRGFGLGAAYGIGIALVYGGLGLVVVLTGSTFGVLNSMPWFNAVMALVFVILALAMFDVIHIDLTRFQPAGGRMERRGSYGAAVGLGGLSALLAGACVAPVVIAVLVLAGNLYAAGVTLGLALPFVLGLGMALPWPLAGAGLAFLPKPGSWMTWVKYGFGAFILALAFYYATVAVSGWRKPRALQPDATGVIHVSADAGPSAWAEVVRQAGASGKPVFIDFWATWCKNCEAMDATTFRDPDVRARLAGFEWVKCQAERPSNGLTSETLAYFGVKGLPTYVVLKPGSGAVDRPAP